MSAKRTAVLALLAFRVLYGVGLVVAPSRLALRWLGSDAERAPTQVPLRALGVREAVLHLGGIQAGLQGKPLRPWLAASVAGDLTDIAWTVLGRRELPDGAAVATAVVAGGSAALSVAAAAAVDD